MVAMAAQRAGVSARTYYYTMTEQEFALDVEAWIQGWAFPAKVMLGGGKDSGRDRRRSKRGGKGRQRIFDLDAMDTPETAHQMAATLGQSFQVANDAMKAASDSRRMSATRIDGTKIR